MISLVFLVCTDLQCITMAPKQVFDNMKSCQIMAEFVLDRAKNDPEMGRHTAQYECKAWGEPA